MAKKERNQEVVFAPDMDTVKTEENMYETEAYGTPQPEAGSDVTVMKQVGIGGPVPIVAPKHNTIQLQPIVVPLAVVPYMTQDSNVLRTDTKQQAQYSEEDYSEAAEFTAVDQKKKVVKKQHIVSRVFALVSFIISAVIVLPFILSYFGIQLFGDDMSYLNVIKILQDAIANGGESVDWLRFSMYMGCFGFTGIVVIVSLLSILFGKYPRAFMGLFTLVPMGTMITVIILDVIANTFVAENVKVFVVLLAITILNFVLSIIFSIVLNRIEDKKERIVKTSEI